MGWSGGTEIFDRSIYLYISNCGDVDVHMVENFVLGMYDMLCDQDWDTVGESSYFGLLDSALSWRKTKEILNKEG